MAKKTVEHSEKFALVKSYYVRKLWNEYRVRMAVVKGWITAEDITKAKEIMKTTAEQKAANLPQQMIENIAKGRLSKFLKEVCLLNQEDIMDPKKTVREAMKAADAELQILAFKRFTLRAE